MGCDCSTDTAGQARWAAAENEHEGSGERDPLYCGQRQSMAGSAEGFPSGLHRARGIVNLSATRADHDNGLFHRSCSGDFRPQVHRCGTQFAIMIGGYVVARDVKEVGDRVMDRDKAL